MMCELIVPGLPPGNNDSPSEQPEKIEKEVNEFQVIWSPQTSITLFESLQYRRLQNLIQ